MGSLTPAQQLIKIVKEEMTSLMGGEEEKIHLSGSPPVPIMLSVSMDVGKQPRQRNSRNILRKEKKRPYLVPADVYRPAAIDQLQKLGEELKVDFYRPGSSPNANRHLSKGKGISP